MAAGDHEHRWRKRPVLAGVLRVVAFAVPIVAAVAASSVITRLVPGRDQHGLLWWGVVLVVPAVTALAMNRAARRLLPLTALCKLSLVFPDHAPSRMSVALRAGTVRQLQRRIEEAEQHSAGGHSLHSAQYLLELVAALNVHDRRTRGHTERVRAYADLLAEELHLPAADRDRLHWAALLHDIGKIAVPSEILNKQGPPDEEEWAILQRHPAEGENLAAPLTEWLGEWVHAVDQHHERWDGHGYPRQLAGSDITLSARIVCVADSFEVMTATRSYKRPMSAAAARAELTRCAGAHFDPAVVRAFMSISLGRLRWVMGPLSVLAQMPVLPRLRDALQEGVTGAARTATVAVAATGVAAAAVTVTTTSVPPRPRVVEVGAQGQSPRRSPSADRVAAGQPAAEEPAATGVAPADTRAAVERESAPAAVGTGLVAAGRADAADPLAASASATRLAGPASSSRTVAEPSAPATTATTAGVATTMPTTPASTIAPVPPASGPTTTNTTTTGTPTSTTVTTAPPAAATTTTTTACPALTPNQTGANLNGRDLRCYGTLVDYAFTRASLRGANLSKLVLLNVAIGEADFTNADFTGTDLSEAKGERAIFTGANFTGANLKGTKIKSENAVGAIWSGTICPDGKTSDSKGGSCFK